MLTAEELPDVEACGVCDKPGRGHARTWHPEVGWHSWVAPSQAVLARRLADRKARLVASADGADVLLDAVFHQIEQAKEQGSLMVSIQGLEQKIGTRESPGEQVIP